MAVNCTSLNCTQGISAVAPTGWFSASVSDPPDTSIWPWTQMSIEQWRRLWEVDQGAKDFMDIMIQVSNAVCWVGVVGSMLIFLTVFSKSKMTKSSFYLALVAVAFFDLVFVLLKFFRWVALIIPQTPAAVSFYNYASGIAYTCSLMSDMLTLTLTVERYSALAAPVFYKAMTPKKIRAAWFVAATVSLVISGTRLHYSFDSVLFNNADLQKKAWFVAMVYFSDNVVPFLLTAVMLFLVAAMLKVLYFRRKAAKTKVGTCEQGNLNTASRRREQEMKKTMSLLSALLSMYFMNQIGYMLYATGALLLAKQVVTYFSSYPEIETYVTIHIFYVVAAGVSSPLEVLSRSLVFFTYVLFNHSFRSDFVDALRRLGLWKKQQTVVFQ